MADEVFEGGAALFAVQAWRGRWIDSEAETVMRCLLIPDAANGGLNLLLETFDQFAVCFNDGLLSLDFKNEILEKVSVAR